MSLSCWNHMEHKQTRRRRQQMWLRAIIFQLFNYYAWKMCSNYPGIKFGTCAWDKIEHLSSYAHVVHTPAKQVISSRIKNESVYKMSKNEKCTCKACKILFSLSLKYANLWGFSCHRRRGCLISLLGSLSNHDNDGNENVINLHI